jgi:hypothetical protein
MVGLVVDVGTLPLLVYLLVHQMDWSPWHNGRYRMLIHELRVTVPAQEYAKVIEPSHDTLQLDAIDEKDSQWCLALTDVVQKRVLKILSSFCGHCCSPLFFSLFLDFDWAGRRAITPCQPVI